MLMLVIRTCANVEDNELKRYLLLYFEVTGLGLENCDPERRSMFVLVWFVNWIIIDIILLFIYLICYFIIFSNSLLKDLESANEYLVGATLRFISKITDKEIMSQLLASVVRRL